MTVKMAQKRAGMPPNTPPPPPPKGPKNGTMESKRHQNDPKMMPKLCLNDPKVTPSDPDRPKKKGPKMAYIAADRSKMAQKGSKKGQKGQRKPFKSHVDLHKIA